MIAKESAKNNEQEATHVKKQVKRYAGKNEKVTSAIKEEKAGPRKSRGKKQRRQFKLAPNRG
jgi:hypothetical protein